MTTSPILLAEDAEDDFFFFLWAAERAALGNPVERARNGQEAIDYLAAVEGAGRQNGPCLAILDIKMPRCNGLEVLRWIRCRTAYATLPVIIFSSSVAGRDFREAYEAGANSCLIKPNSPEQLIRVLACIKAYWLELNVNLVQDPD